MTATDEQARSAVLHAVDAACPLRPGQPCTLCHPEARLGPQDCPTVAIVMDDPDLRAEAARLRAEVAFRGRRTQVAPPPS